MKVVILSDTHNQIPDNIPDGDLIIHCGDFTNGGTYNEIKKFLLWFSLLSHKHKIVIPGNHERLLCPFINSPKRVYIIHKFKSLGINLLLDEMIIIEDIKIYGTSYCNGDFDIMYKWGFYVHDEEQLTEKWNKIPEDTDILITHIPPYGILDIYNSKHYGCKLLLDRIRQFNPLYHIFGHIHSGYGEFIVNKTYFINSSYLKEDGNHNKIIQLTVQKKSI